MFFAKFIPAVLLAAGLVFEVSAHALVEPPIGVRGAATRNDVKRPNGGAACGQGVNIATALGSSTAVRANGNTFTVTARNFNGGGDGSRFFTAKVDATGTGRSFVAATISKNGNRAPSNVGTEQLTVQLPAGTKCAGGNGKNTCLVQFISSSGFGDCVAVTQGAGKREDVLAEVGERRRREIAEAVAGKRMKYERRRLPAAH